MTDALRVQRHEFANRLHVTAGLIDAGRVPDARDYLDEVLEARGRPRSLPRDGSTRRAVPGVVPGGQGDCRRPSAVCA